MTFIILTKEMSYFFLILRIKREYKICVSLFTELPTTAQDFYLLSCKLYSIPLYALDCPGYKTIKLQKKHKPFSMHELKYQKENKNIKKILKKIVRLGWLVEIYKYCRQGSKTDHLAPWYLFASSVIILLLFLPLHAN